MEHHDPSILQPKPQQDTFYSDDNLEQFQNQEERLHTVHNPQQETNPPQHIPDPSETSTVQNASEIFDTTINNPRSLTITNGSNIVQIPVRNITQNVLTNQNQSNTNININQDSTATVSTSDTNITPQFQTQQPSPRNYDPPSLPPQYSTPHLVLQNKVLPLLILQTYLRFNLQYNIKQLL